MTLVPVRPVSCHHRLNMRIVMIDIDSPCHLVPHDVAVLPALAPRLHLLALLHLRLRVDSKTHPLAGRGQGEVEGGVLGDGDEVPGALPPGQSSSLSSSSSSSLSSSSQLWV